MSQIRRRPIVIDLFAGAGGFSLGFEQAGFDVAAAVEVDPIHAAIHKFNFPQCAVIPTSVIGLSGKEIRRLAGLESSAVDVVVGGAPCQGFSLIGQRALDDPRNALVGEFVRLVTELDASYFVFENVKGLTVGRHKQVLEELIEAFDRVGYSVRLPWKVLNASAFGVPQDRQRLILMGAKKGLKLPDYPAPHTRPAGKKTLDLSLPQGPSCLDAVGDLPEAETFHALAEQDCVVTDRWGEPSQYARIMRCLDPGSWLYGYKRKHNPLLLSCSARTSHTDISRRRFSETLPGSVEPISRFYKLAAESIANTLRAGTDSARGAFTSPRPIHYAHPRCITVREMARLHGFPDWFRLHVTKWHGARQVGNAVPPPLARAVAAELIAAMDVTPTKPRKTLSLGNDDLLSMDMSEAAAFWGVDVAISRRDRKSGARKRKQEEIELERSIRPKGRAYG